VNPMRTRLYSLDELEDIPGTTVFTARRSRQAYHLHKFCMSLMEAANREVFKQDERAYLDRFRMSEKQKLAVLSRDFNQLIELGGNIYFLVKLSNTDGWSAQRAVGSMTGMTPDAYAAMMRSGGRPIKGNRSIRGKN
jgi:protocatechuate 4,5-dioxygenase, alpha chain